MFMDSLYQDLNSRGIIKQTTSDELEKALTRHKLTLYCGFDPSSDSLHVGSLLPLITLKRFENAGHKVLAVIGGATGMIGDPSFKSAERTLLNDSQIEFNLNGIKTVISQFLHTQHKGGPTQILNNAQWFAKYHYIEFLRDIGKHFTINHMLTKESVRSRLEDRDHGISYTEFSYMLLQAYDFYYLHKNHGCTLQLGGSDQWGNITAGCELIRRMSALESKEAHTAPQVFGLTHPLITKSDGTKFGKTESGTIWLDPQKTTPYQFYQFWLNTADADVIHYLNYFTFLPLKEIHELAKLTHSEPEKRIAQKKLAEELTLFVHGEDAYKNAINSSQALFQGDYSALSLSQIKESLHDAPSTDITITDLKEIDGSLIELLALTKLCPSKGIARKDLQAGGIYLNNQRVSDIQKKITEQDFLHNAVLILRKGKKNYHLVFLNK